MLFPSDSGPVDFKNTASKSKLARDTINRIARFETVILNLLFPSSWLVLFCIFLSMCMVIDGFSQSITPFKVVIFVFVFVLHGYSVAAVLRKGLWLKPCPAVLPPRLKSWVNLNHNVSKLICHYISLVKALIKLPLIFEPNTIVL